MDGSLIRCDGAHPGFRELIIKLDRELRSHQSSHDDIYISHNLVPEDVRVILALQEGQPVGCACLRGYSDDTVELKRMYVLPEYRGRGLSRKILKGLEEWAAELDYSRIILETGHRLKEAHGLYRSSGFRAIENYGPYKGISESLCFEKMMEES